jgi:hypothetical protein
MLRSDYAWKATEPQALPLVMDGVALVCGRRREKTFVHYVRTSQDRLSASHRAQRGGGTVKAIVWTVILVYGAFAAYKILPAYVTQYQLVDKMQEQARFAVVNRYSDDQIRDDIFKVVQDLEIPVKRDQIKVTNTAKVVGISMEYTVPVDLLIYHLDLHFTPSSENRSIL